MPLGVWEGVSKDKKDSVGMVWMTAPSPPPPPPPTKLIPHIEVGFK